MVPRAIVFAAILASQLSANAALAEQSSAETLDAAIDDMFAACKIPEEIDAFLGKSGDLAVKSAREQYAQFSEEQWQTYDTIVHEDLRKNTNAYLAFTKKLYTAHFSVDEIKAASDFCRTPAGIKMSSLRAQMEIETFDMRQEWMRRVLTAAMQDAYAKVSNKGQGL